MGKPRLKICFIAEGDREILDQVEDFIRRRIEPEFWLREHETLHVNKKRIRRAAFFESDIQSMDDLKKQITKK